MYVFVYGTLRKGYSNHRLLEWRADLVGIGTINARLHGGYSCPVIAKPRNADDVVIGELYQLHEATLKDTVADLDMLEIGYQRTSVPVTVAGQKYTGDVYFSKWPCCSESYIPHGDWTKTHAGIGMRR